VDIPLAAVEQAWALPEVVTDSQRRLLVQSALRRQAAASDLRQELVVTVLGASHRFQEVATAMPSRAWSATVATMVLLIFQGALAVTALWASHCLLQAIACPA